MEAKVNKPGTKGLAHVKAAFGYSMKGLKAAVKYEEAFRIELFLGVFMLPAAFWLGKNAVEYSLLIGSLFIVLMVELINSAIEAAIDRIGVEKHKLSGRAKDLGSAAVFFTHVNVLMIWGFIIYERFFA